MAVDFDQLLGALHEIQGLADPEHESGPPSRRLGAMRERMNLIYSLACEQMRESGWQPPEPRLRGWDSIDGGVVGPNFCVICQTNNCVCLTKETQCKCPNDSCPVHGTLDKSELRKGRRVRG